MNIEIGAEMAEQLWSGTIGSLVAAFIGGLVALIVVRLTNGQARRQAERQEQISAMADLLAAAEQTLFIIAKDERLAATTSSFLNMRSAVHRLHMSGGDARPVAEVIDRWPYLLTSLRTDLEMARQEGSGDEEKYFGRLNSGVTELVLSLRSWTDGSKRTRRDALRSLGDHSKKLDAYVAETAESDNSPEVPPERTQASGSAHG
ncbi:hypothetical protein ACX80U_05795 [Arthrobacter sp. TmT3-37]